MASNSNQCMESHIVLLNDQVQEKRLKIKELESEWDAYEKVLQEKKRNIEQSLQALYPDVYSKLTRIKEIKSETEAVEAEIKQREDEIVELSSDIGKQPKLAPRRSYIEQINEINKNSRKQDADIQLILKDTRELQLESNTIQERLNRTFAVLEETISRSNLLKCWEAKKDAVARKAHTLLTSIHETFEQITEKILATDRCRRNIADYEARLATYDSRSLNMDRLRVDLDAIRKENDLLKQHLHNT